MIFCFSLPQSPPITRPLIEHCDLKPLQSIVLKDKLSFETTDHGTFYNTNDLKNISDFFKNILKFKLCDSVVLLAITVACFLFLWIYHSIVTNKVQNHATKILILLSILFIFWTKWNFNRFKSWYHFFFFFAILLMCC